MNRLVFAVGIFCAFVNSRALASAQPDPLCILGKCGGQLAACEGGNSCRTTLDCVRGCTDSDPELQQACTIRCTEASEGAEFDNLTACMVDQGCLTRKDAAVCARPGQGAILAEMKLSDLEGSWYVLRGLSKAYDCWSCQKMTFSSTSATTSRYDYDYLVNSPQISHISCSASQVLEQSTQTPLTGRLAISYKAHGVVGSDDWYVLSKVGDFALIYYCGLSPTDEYRGAVVIGRDPHAVLTDAVSGAFQKALDAAGLPAPLSLGEFCSLDNSTCAQP